MKIGPTTIGYVAVLIGGQLVGSCRNRYLIHKSATVDLGKGFEIELRTAVWAYITPILGICMGAGIGHYAIGQNSNGVFLIGLVISLFMMISSGYIFWSLVVARLVVTEDKLLYKRDGKCQEILAANVIRVKFQWFSFLVRLRWQEHIRLPTTFQSSEITLAFLRRAIAKNSLKVSWLEK